MAHIENGKIVFENVECGICNSTGFVKDFQPCPNDGKRQFGLVCAFCGTTTRYHKWIDVGTKKCYHCNGTGMELENSCSSSTINPYAILPIRVVREDRGVTFNERYLGMVCFYSVSGSYGLDRLSDDEILARVTSGEGGSIQYTKFMNKDGIIADEILVCVYKYGYSVRAGFRKEGK